MGVDTKISFDKLRREPNRNVAGTVYLSVYGDIAGLEFDEKIAQKEFNFHEGKEQKVFDESVKIKVLDIKLTVEVHEHNAGHCCVQGHVHVDAPIGGGIGKDLDPNCHPIP